MEGGRSGKSSKNKKKAPAAASSSAQPVHSDLFGPSDPTYGDDSSSEGFFCRVFDASTTFVSPQQVEAWRRQSSAPDWDGKYTSIDEPYTSKEYQSGPHNNYTPKYDPTPSQPTELSSSLLYGSRNDVPISAETLAALKKKERGYEDSDSNIDVRGTWWKGSYHY